MPFPTVANTAAMNQNGDIVYSGGKNLYFPRSGGSYTTVPVPGAGNFIDAVNVTGYNNSGDTTGSVIGNFLIFP
jgi:hypothetical protein